MDRKKNSNDMSLDEVSTAIDELEKAIAELTALMDEEEKGGPGSGCQGENCGRPSINNAKPTRVGVRPSAVSPGRTQIVYTEEPSSDGRPRSGVRPGKH